MRKAVILVAVAGAMVGGVPSAAVAEEPKRLEYETLPTTGRCPSSTAPRLARLGSWASLPRPRA